MMLRILFAATVLSLASCMKPAEEFYGSVSISGTLTDKQTGKPVPGGVVFLTGTTQKKGPLGYLKDDERLAVDTSAEDGTYAFSFEANGETAFRLNLQPDDRYLQYKSGSGEDYTVKGIGAHTVNIAGIPTGFAKVALRHTSPRAESVLTLVGPAGSVFMNPQRRDTTLMLRLYGDNTTVSVVTLTADTTRQTRNLTVGAGDTLQVQFQF